MNDLYLSILHFFFRGFLEQIYEKIQFVGSPTAQDKCGLFNVL